MKKACHFLLTLIIAMPNSIQLIAMMPQSVVQPITPRIIIRQIEELDPKTIQQYFYQLRGEGLYKMGLRLVYAHRYDRNLDHLDCVHFIKEINNWVNDCGDQVTQVLSQPYLPYILPFLETIIGEPVITLDLSKLSSADDNDRLTSLPIEIGYLYNLKYLYLNGNRIKTLPIILAKLPSLTSIWTDKDVEIPEQLRHNKNLAIAQFKSLSEN